ncbi:MAG: transketolase, partial [Bacteroidetes bacterium]|nr:transketolase [Bacteroidota bacterium]
MIKEVSDRKNISLSYAKNIRIKTLEMVYKAQASHIGGAFSMADILAVLYSGILKIDSADTNNENRDRFLLSKGHACTSLYAALALTGFFPINMLDEYGTDGTILMSHASSKVPGVEFSTGSLGHALPVACGLALAAKRKQMNYRSFVLLGDGELNEGSNWESFLFAQHHKLDNLIVVIDYNKIQSFGTTAEVMLLDPLADKLKAFNWEVVEVDGHNHDDLWYAFESFEQNGIPKCVIAHTIKGKGVSFMENKL